MQIDVEDRGGVTIIAPEDRLDLLGYLELEEAISGLLREGRTKLVLDLTEVGFMNSTSMAVIHRYSLQASERGGALVRGVLELGGLADLIKIRETVEEAVKEFEPGKKDETDKHKSGGAPPGATDTRSG